MLTASDVDSGTLLLNTLGIKTSQGDIRKPAKRKLDLQMTPTVGARSQFVLIYDYVLEVVLIPLCRVPYLSELC